LCWFFQDLVAPKPKIDGKGIVDRDLAVPAKVARAACAKVIKDAGCETGDTVLATFKHSTPQFFVMDPDFGVEVALVSYLCGPGSEQRLMSQLLLLMPSAASSQTVEAVLQAVNLMSTHDIFKMATRPAQAKHAFVVKVLGRILDNRAPDLSGINDDRFLQIFRTRLPFFIRFDFPGSSAKAPPKSLFGKEAMSALIEGALKKHGEGGCTAKDIAFLTPWRFLIGDTDLDKADQLLKAVQGDHVLLDVAKKGKSSTKEKATGAKKQDVAVAEAMAMFS
jgi:hypothetical protein